MACKASCGLDLDFVPDVFQIWRMEVLPIILILVNVMIIIVVLSSVWSVTMVSWSSSMLTKWSARKGMEAEGGFENKGFLWKTFSDFLICDSCPQTLWYPPTFAQISSSSIFIKRRTSSSIFISCRISSSIFIKRRISFFNIHQAQPTYLHDLVAQNGKAWMYSGWGWKPDSLATLWRHRCAKLQLYDSIRVFEYDHCIVFW